MDTNNKIAVNFSPLKSQEFKVIVFRKIKEPLELKIDFTFPVQQRELPIELSNGDDKNDYWVTFNSQLNFEEFTCNPDTNIGLTISFLNNEVANKCVEVGLTMEDQYFLQLDRLQNSNKVEKIYFVNHLDGAGKQCIWVKADYLAITEQFGFYTDFQFKKNLSSKNYIQIQKLSLSLDNYGRANTNFYADRYEQLKKFATLYFKKVFQNSHLDFKGLQELGISTLNPKIYQFGNGREGNLASDLKKNVPFQNVNERVKIFFVHKEDEIYFVNNAMNKIKTALKDIYKLEADCVLYKIETSTIRDIKMLIDEINQSHSNINSRCLAFLPIQNEKVNYYYQCKYEFDKLNIPIQFASYQTLKADNIWAFDGLALQVFAKLGGKPWKMKPTNENCLILGLAQANPKQKVDRKSKIKRFFGYSVLVDSSGLYKSLEVFSNELEKDEYLRKLKEHIVSIIIQYADEYQKIVIHTPFKIKEEELSAIRNAIDEAGASHIQFVVMRINTFNDYFGYNKQRNNLTALEGSLAKLSDSQYLIWFEGLKVRTEERPNKRFSGPTFIEFHYPNNLTDEEKMSYLQDVINLSGANWRGFRAKAEPVSIYYCKLVTEFIKQFRAIGYDKLDFKNFQPWFL